MHGVVYWCTVLWTDAGGPVNTVVDWSIVVCTCAVLLDEKLVDTKFL